MTYRGLDVEVWPSYGSGTFGFEYWAYYRSSGEFAQASSQRWSKQPVSDEDIAANVRRELDSLLEREALPS